MVSPFKLVQSLAALFVQKGGVIQRAHVEQLRPGHDGAAILNTSAGAVRAEHLVICAGAFSKPFAAAFGIDVPLESWRGYHIMVPSAGVPLNGVVADGEMHFAVTPMEDGVRVAGLIELAGVDAPPNYARADLFVRLAKCLIPTFPDTPASRWMGHRPGMPDTLPVLGRAAGHPKVYFAFGHGQFGLTFGAVTGAAIADLVAGRTAPSALAAYDALRFQ